MRETNLSDYCVEEEKGEKGEEHGGAVEAQHGVGDEMIHGWQCDRQRQLPDHFGQVIR